MIKAVIIPLVLIVSLIIAFCSCGSKTDNGETTVRESFYSGSRTYPVSVVTGPLTGSVSTRLTEISTSLLTQPVTEPPVLPPVVPVSVSGSYLLDLGEHGQDDPAAVRLELLEKGGRLGVLLTMVYDTYEWTSNFYIVEPTESEGTVSAVYDGESEHFELTCDGKIADLDFLWEGNVDPASGLYLRSDSSEGEFRYPDIPEKEKDPDTPDGAIDAVIAAAAREFLGLPSDAVLTADDCANVTELNIFEDRLVSLDGIEYFSDLKKIFVNSSYLSDISPLASIKSIEEISISWSYIETIPDFSGCENLTRLDLACNAISDISPLSSLKNLKFLNLSSNNVKSIAPIKDITSFEYLILDGNPILDWESVSDNQNLISALKYDYNTVLSVNDRAKAILKETVEDGMSDLEKEIAIYRKIHEIANYETFQRPERPYGYYVLMMGKGVCGDYSEAVSLLMNLAGLNCISVYSDTHAWNMIELDGKWYEIDCLWDDDQEPLYWQYFNVSRSRMNAEPDHQSDSRRYPLALQSMPKLEYYMLTD